ncbi:hypothetical protein AAMO2058_000103900 [Amorphochlora amoebiformis]
MELDNPDGKPGASPDPTQQPEDDKGESSRGVDPVEIQVRFFTKDSEVSVPGNAFSVPLRLGPKGLSEIVNALAEDGESMEEEDDIEDDKKKEQKDNKKKRLFDFLIDGHFLKGSLAAYAANRRAAGTPVDEKGIALEYTEALPPPSQGPTATHPDWVSALAASHPLSASQFLVSGCYDGIVRIYSGNSPSALTNSPSFIATTEATHPKPIKAVTILKTSADSKSFPYPLLASASIDPTIHLYALPGPDKPEIGESKGISGSGSSPRPLSLLARLEGHTTSVTSLSPLRSAMQTPRMVSGGFGGQVHLWKVTKEGIESEGGGKRRKVEEAENGEGEEKATRGAGKLDPSGGLEGCKGAVMGLAWPVAGAVYSCGFDKNVRMFDVETGVNSLILPCKAAGTCLDFGMDANLIATGHTDKSICLWDPRQSGQKNVVKLRLRSHKSWVTGVAWSPITPHRLASTSHDGTLKVWDARASEALHTLKAHDGKALDLAWWGSGIATGGTDRRIGAYSVSGSRLAS